MAAAVERRPSVAFLTALNDGTPEDRHSSHSNTNYPTTDSGSTSTAPSPASETATPTVCGVSASDTGSNSRVESLSRGEGRRGRDVKSAEVDVVGYQPLPDSVDMSSITEKVRRASCHTYSTVVPIHQDTCYSAGGMMRVACYDVAPVKQPVVAACGVVPVAAVVPPCPAGID